MTVDKNISVRMIHDALAGRVQVLHRRPISLDGWNLTEQELPEKLGCLNDWLRSELQSSLAVLLLREDEDDDCIDLALPFEYSCFPTPQDECGGSPVDYPLTIDVNIHLGDAKTAVTHRYRLDDMLLTRMDDAEDASVWRKIQEALRSLADAMEQNIVAMESKE